MPEHISDDPPSKHIAEETTLPAPDKAVLLAQMERLEGAILLLTKGVGAADAFSHQTRKITDRVSDVVKVLTVVVVLLAVALAGVIVGMVRADRADDKADRLQEYQVANCEAGNESRAAQLDMWTGPAGITELISKGGSAGAKAFADKVAAKARATYAPRDCSKVAEGKVR